jgi:hypothetical protein
MTSADPMLHATAEQRDQWGHCPVLPVPYRGPTVPGHVPNGTLFPTKCTTFAQGPIRDQSFYYSTWLKSSALYREKGGIMNVSHMTVDECVVNNGISSVALQQQLLMALARWPCDSGLLLMAGDHRGMGL